MILLVPDLTEDLDEIVRVVAAAQRALHIQDGLAAVAEWEAEHGAPTEDQLAWADRVLVNAGSKEDLTDAVNDLWRDLSGANR